MFRRIIYYRVNLGVRPDKNQVTGLGPLGKHTRDDIFPLGPERKIAMRIVFRDPADIF